MEFMKQIVERGVYITAFSATFRTEKKKEHTAKADVCLLFVSGRIHFRIAHQVAVDLPGTGLAFRNGPYDQGLAPSQITGRKQLAFSDLVGTWVRRCRMAGGQRQLERIADILFTAGKAGGDQHHIGRQTLLAACDRHHGAVFRFQPDRFDRDQTVALADQPGDGRLIDARILTGGCGSISSWTIEAHP